MDILVFLVASGVMGIVGFALGWLMGDRGARRILKALRERHERAEYLAVKFSRMPRAIRNQQVVVESVNYETDCYAVLDVAEKAYRRKG